MGTEDERAVLERLHADAFHEQRAELPDLVEFAEHPPKERIESSRPAREPRCPTRVPRDHLVVGEVLSQVLELARRDLLQAENIRLQSADHGARPRAPVAPWRHPGADALVEEIERGDSHRYLRPRRFGEDGLLVEADHVAARIAE